MSFHFDEIIDRRGSNCVKYDAARQANPLLPEDNIPMWVADMDFACPQPILDAMKARLDRRILGYVALEDDSYYEALDGFMRRHHGFGVKKEQVVISEGVVKAMQVAVKQLTKPGDQILMHTPGYHPFEDAALSNGREPLFSPLLHPDDDVWEVDWEDFEQKVKDPRTTLFFLCSPHNPTGRVWTEQELRRMTELCWENGVFIFCDEIHHDLLRKGVKHLSLPALFPDEKRYICATAPSKTFNTAGNAMSNILFPDEAMAEQWRMKHWCGGLNALSIEATKAAYSLCDDWLDELRDYLDGNFAFLDAWLKEHMPKARFSIPQATYLAWVDLRAYGLSDGELNEKVSRAGLFIQFGEGFIAHGEGFARINVGCPRALLEKGLKRLKTALEEGE